MIFAVSLKIDGFLLWVIIYFYYTFKVYFTCIWLINQILKYRRFNIKFIRIIFIDENKFDSNCSNRSTDNNWVFSAPSVIAAYLRSLEILSRTPSNTGQTQGRSIKNSSTIQVIRLILEESSRRS